MADNEHQAVRLLVLATLLTKGWLMKVTTGNGPALLLALLVSAVVFALPQSSVARQQQDRKDRKSDTERVDRLKRAPEVSLSAKPGAATTIDVPRDLVKSDALIRDLILECKTKAARIRVDGRARDWRGLPTFYDDSRYGDGSMDIVRVGIAPRSKDLIVMAETREPPTKRDFAFYVGIDFMGQPGIDIQIALGQRGQLNMEIFDRTDGFKALPSAQLKDVTVKVDEVIEARIPYASVKKVLPKEMADLLDGDNARPYMRVEVFSFIQESRERADHGPSAASYRFLKEPYSLDAPAPGQQRDALPVGVPFEGKWHVINGAMGIATHAGIHAYDFMVHDRTHSQASKRGSADNDDYYSFGKPILAPIDCVVVQTASQEPDGIPERKEKKPGNNVISNVPGRSNQYLTLLHLKQDGVAVEVGQKLKAGEVVGVCGNSGTSTAPHLHLQLELPRLHGKRTTFPIAFERAIVSLNPGPDDPWARYVENWEIRSGVFVESAEPGGRR